MRRWRAHLHAAVVGAAGMHSATPVSKRARAYEGVAGVSTAADGTSPSTPQRGAPRAVERAAGPAEVE